jgi:wyosine [tRNA(Phe)-imidazoG37] synthetase (radical SAM superfamily)
MTELKINKETKLVEGILYGPVKSRRFGQSLGINISGESKFCSFNCIYCFRGRNQGLPGSGDYVYRTPDAEMVRNALIQWLMGNSGKTSVEDWTIAGNADPLDNPDFPEIIPMLIELRNRICPDTKISVLSNGMGLIPRFNPFFETTLKALEKVDRPCIKLDSGIGETWHKIANPVFPVAFHEWMESVRNLKGLRIQTMLFKGRFGNVSRRELNALKSAYKKLNPLVVDILTLDKVPQTEGLKPLSEEEFRKAKNILLE